MSDLKSHAEDERMIFALAHRVVRRLSAIPQVILSYQDIEQELWVGWCIARDRFSHSRGIPWPAYMQRGVKQHINRVIEKQLERFPEQTFALSLDKDMLDEEGTSLSNIIPSSDPTPDVIAERNSNFDHAKSVLSERASIFVSLLSEQPPELLQEVLIAQDKAKHAEALGAPYKAPKRIVANMVFDLMGASRSERTKIIKEVEQIGERISSE